ncbi:flavin reductase [Roseomonas sp. OT10]|uniref:flavin reductase n=1 Tax=Roseomonas cutis TaxID=2897332 RepID=UPI001E2D5D6E|nr:flavin reductase [Roseomonas sp. OT10]UFN50041.1 flavin reductase [Roseomonas sp. OT10]
MDPVRQEFRDAMARLGAAVNIVTSDGAAGPAGFTASAVCSVTDDPPTLLVCMNRSSSLNPIVKANGVFCVNVLSARQQGLSRAFASSRGIPMADRFAEPGWDRLVTGSPASRGAVASVDCEIEEVLEKGTHSVLFGAVKAIRLNPPEDVLIWWARDYRVLSGAA